MKAKRLTELIFSAVPVHKDAGSPLHRQVCDGIRDAILAHRLKSGVRLPSTRQLAADLAVSRNTVMTAFEQLLAEGYVEARSGAGTYVAPTLPDELLRARHERVQPERAWPSPARARSRRGDLLARTPMSFAHEETRPRAFQVGVPAVEAFPFKTWGRIMSRRWRRLPRTLLYYGDPAGYRPLREAIADYVGAARAVRCRTEQVIIVAGSQPALELCATVLLDPGDAAWIEDPGYPGARGALLGGGASLVPVPVDDDGIDVTAGTAGCPGARLAYVTPSHQYPLGVVLSLPRRLALLEWAERTGAWIVEDDYDSEFRYRGRPLSALQGLDRHGRVIYVGTFSKVLFPSLRLGYLVVPPDLVDAFVAANVHAAHQAPTFSQCVLTDFIVEGHLTRHIRRMRALYEERQAALLKAARGSGGLLEVRPTEGGMHLMGWLPPGMDDRLASLAVAAAGITAPPLSFYCRAAKPRGGLLLGYTGIEPREIRGGMRRLTAALREVHQGAAPADGQAARARV
jgi:GntR family transcriptional regulator/MocR family aminotransferase